MQKKGGYGFTIVELLIVVVVVGVLATIVIVAFDGVTKRAYDNRARSELASLAKATQAYYGVYGEYPPDANRGLPSGITEFIDGSAENWPKAPWPDSVYDYDNFTGSDGNPVVQISVRFCPQGGPLSACKFPNEPWVVGFGVDSSAYWCILGQCKSHPSQPVTYPGYCLNCR